VTDEIDIHVAADGRLEGASAAGLAALGYSQEELRALPRWALWDRDPTGGEAAWARWVAAPDDPRPSILFSAGGRALLCECLGVTRDQEGGGSTVHLRVLGPSTAPHASRGILPRILEEWRRAESILARLPAEDEGRPSLEVAVERLRQLYQAESARRR